MPRKVKERHFQKKILPNRSISLTVFDLQEYIPFLLRQAQLAILPIFTTALEAPKLSLADWRILAALHRHGSLRVHELLALTGLEPPTLSRTLGNLQKRSLLKRVTSKDDGRGIVVEPTQEGMRIAETVIPHALAVQNTALQNFTQDEKAFLIKLLKRIRQNVVGEDAPSTLNRSWD